MTNLGFWFFKIVFYVGMAWAVLASKAPTIVESERLDRIFESVYS